MILKKLFENTEVITPEQAIELINTQASKFVKECNYELVYSGRKNKIANIYRGTYRTDRKPVDIDGGVQIEFDKLLAKHNTSLRSNSLFVTGSYFTALGYGKPYIIFPLGNYKYHWYEDIEDLYTYYKHEIRDSSFTNTQIENFYHIDTMVLYDKLVKEETLDDDYRDKYPQNNMPDVQYDRLIWEQMLEDEGGEIYFSAKEIKKLFPDDPTKPYDFLANELWNASDVIRNARIEDAINIFHEIVLNSDNGFLAIDTETFITDVFMGLDHKEKYNISGDFSRFANNNPEDALSFIKHDKYVDNEMVDLLKNYIKYAQEPSIWDIQVRLKEMLSYKFGYPNNILSAVSSSLHSGQIENALSKWLRKSDIVSKRKNEIAKELSNLFKKDPQIGDMYLKIYNNLLPGIHENVKRK